jgi:hypothetical protein
MTVAVVDLSRLAEEIKLRDNRDDCPRKGHSLKMPTLLAVLSKVLVIVGVIILVLVFAFW